ncbi:MAG: hypothetical protein ACOC1F_02050 [Myxococcota bacterium]
MRRDTQQPSGGCDCQDGESRSCYDGPAGTEGVGSCVAGTETCIDGAWGDCQGAVEPEPGRCDVLSCTGDVNPGCDCLIGDSRSCYTGDPGDIGVGICHQGVQECMAVGSSGSNWGPCAGEVLPEAEQCDGKDHDCGLQVLPLDTVALHGAGSDPDGTGPMSYQWRLLFAPAGNATGLSGAQQNPTLFAQLVGDYEVGLRVVDATGCVSEEKKVLIRVKPNTAVYVQLTWDESSDVDLHMVQGSTSQFATGNPCYFGAPNPDWGAVDPSLDIDDLAGCNPENIYYGEFGGLQPPLGSDYGIFVHCYCEYRGHRVTEDGDPSAICYDPGSEVTVPVVATVRVYIDGQLAEIEGTGQDAELSEVLEYGYVWKPVWLEYDATGMWRVHAATDPLQFAEGCAIPMSTSCVCGMEPNDTDPYCGPGGAACRQLYP